eukprot:CAMPEP_0184707080 /NCGR_PEP_ID=MMETSP0313-20130426/37089_1 /TAXON_ID=2792 /ORGANISM="Porphyridium aerugineum, Strain SAG 1380-2" /LENGTH=1577 /DNA_ID=CAMNT_0027168653 /DNA_START=155 /DNA_END=4888 /DNA_ORIENTATION=-
MSAIHAQFYKYAANGQLEELVALYRKHQGSINSDEKAGMEGNTALIIAAHQGNSDMVMWLLNEAMADVNALNDQGNSALMAAVELGHEFVAEILVSHGANVHAKNHISQTALIKAAKGGHITISNMLMENGARIHDVDINGRSALIEASAAGQTNMAKFLLKKGANICQQDIEGKSSLAYSILCKNQELIQLHATYTSDLSPKELAQLLKGLYHALQGIRNPSHNELVHLLASYFANMELEKLPNEAAAVYQVFLADWPELDQQHWALRDCSQSFYEQLSLGKFDELKQLYQQHKELVNVNWKPLHTKDSALLKAIIAGHENVVFWLLQNTDIDVNQQGDFLGYTALHMATHNDKLVQALIDHGIDLDAQSEFGETALIKAVHEGQEKVVELLLNSGARIDIRDNEKKTALNYAKERNLSRCVELLMNRTQVDMAKNGSDLWSRMSKSEQLVYSTLWKKAAGEKSDQLKRYGFVELFGDSTLSNSTLDQIWNMVSKGSETVDLYAFTVASRYVALAQRNEPLEMDAAMNFAHRLIPNVTDFTSMKRELAGSDSSTTTAANDDIDMLKMLSKGKKVSDMEDSSMLQKSSIPSMSHRLVSEDRDYYNKMFWQYVNENNLDQIKQLFAVQKQAIDVNWSNTYADGNTPLMQASLQGFTKVVRWLLESSNIMVDATNRNQETALTLSAIWGKDEVASALLMYGANVDFRGVRGCTALHHASLFGFDKVVQSLVDYGADVSARDASGETPLIKAAMNGHDKAIRILLQYGAKKDEQDDQGMTAMACAKKSSLLSCVALLSDETVVGRVSSLLSASGSCDVSMGDVWQVANTVQVTTLEGALGMVMSVCWSPDGRRLASGSTDKAVRVWDVATGRELAKFEGHQGWVMSVCWSPDGRMIASGSVDRTTRVWNVTDGHESQQFVGHVDWVTTLAWSPDGQYLASGSSDNTIRVWGVGLGIGEMKTLVGHSDWVMNLCWSADARLIASGSNDCSIRVWEVASCSQIERFDGHTDGVTSVCWSPDCQWIASGSKDKTIGLWDMSSGELIAKLQGHKGWVSSVCWSPDGKLIASGSHDNSIHVRDMASGCLVNKLEGHTNMVNSVCWSPDGKFIGSASSDKTIRMWEVAGDLISAALNQEVSSKSVGTESNPPSDMDLETLNNKTKDLPMNELPGTRKMDKRSVNEMVDIMAKSLKLPRPEILYKLARVIASKDSALGIRLCYESAQLGFVNAQYDLANMYYQANPSREAEAVKWYRRAAEQGHTKSQYMLGCCLNTGVGVTQDEAEAIVWLTRAAEDGNDGNDGNGGRAQYELGEIFYVQKRDYIRAVSWLMKSMAIPGGSDVHADAEYLLGLCYSRGHGVTRSDKEAANLFHRAAEHGHIQGMYYYSKCLVSGLGVTRDPRASIMWLERAAAADLPQAQYDLGNCFLHGLYGKAQDFHQAVSWYRRAAAHHHCESEHMLAQCNFDGRGVPSINEHESFTLYRCAASHGHILSQYDLARCYRYGYGVVADASLACYWYESSARQGDFHSQVELVEMYSMMGYIDRANVWKSVIRLRYHEEDEKDEDIDIGMDGNVSGNGEIHCGCP